MSLIDACILGSNNAHNPRGWWNPAAAGRCKNAHRVFCYGYPVRPTIHRTKNGQTIHSGRSSAAYVQTKRGNLLRVNHPRNKHQRAAMQAAAAQGV